MRRTLIACSVMSMALFSCGEKKDSDETKETSSTNESTPDNSINQEDAENEGAEIKEGSNEPMEESYYRGERDQNGLYGYVDSKGNWVIEPKYTRVGGGLVYDRGSVTNEDYQSGYVNSKGEVVIPFKYRFANDFTMDGLAAVKEADKSWEYIDKDGNTVLEANYDQCSGFWEGLAAVSNSGGGMGLINKKGEMVIPMDYYFQVYTDGDKGSYFYYDDRAFVKKHSAGKYGILTNTGEEVTPFIYEGNTMYAKEHGVLIVKVGDKYGAIDLEGNELLPVEYDALSLYNTSDRYTAEKDGVKMKLDLQGNCVEGCN